MQMRNNGKFFNAAVTCLALVLAIGALTLSSVARAADEAVRIGVVDLDQALNSIEEGKAAREELARKQREAEAQLQPMLDKFKAQRDELESKKYVLSEEALYQKQLDLAELNGKIEAKGRELQSKYKLDQERLVGPLRKKMIDIIREIGKEGGYAMILTRDDPGLIYMRESLDITDLVVQRFNRKKG